MRLRKTKQAVVLVLVATALCADRAAIARPQVEVGSIARQIATRLTSSFARTIPAVRLHQTRQDRPAARPAPHPQPVVVEPGTVHVAGGFSPSHFRLPPPLA